jgi:selenocysteine-specific elongation factor
MAVTFHSGTAESSGKMALLDVRELESGKTGWVQIRLAQPLALARGDLFIVRQPSPSLTLGGGSVVDPHPKRHRRFQAPVLGRLDVLERGTPEDVLLQHLQAGEPTDVETLARRGGASSADVRASLELLVERGDVLLPGSVDSTILPRTMLLSRAGWERIRGVAQATLGAFHTANPLRHGMLKEELRARLALDSRAFGRVLAALQAAGDAAEEGPLARLASHQVHFTAQQERQIQDLLVALHAAGASPPTRAELEARLGIGPDLVLALVERGDLVEVAADLVYARDTFDGLRDAVVAAIHARGQVTVAEVRDILNTSRRYVLPLLGYLDEHRVTRRAGDIRTLY